MRYFDPTFFYGGVHSSHELRRIKQRRREEWNDAVVSYRKGKGVVRKEFSRELGNLWGNKDADAWLTNFEYGAFMTRVNIPPNLERRTLDYFSLSGLTAPEEPELRRLINRLNPDFQLCSLLR